MVYYYLRQEKTIHKGENEMRKLNAYDENLFFSIENELKGSDQVIMILSIEDLDRRIKEEQEENNAEYANILVSLKNEISNGNYRMWRKYGYYDYDDNTPEESEAQRKNAGTWVD